MVQRYVILVGDPTTGGGEAIEGYPGYMIECLDGSILPCKAPENVLDREHFRVFLGAEMKMHSYAAVAGAMAALAFSPASLAASGKPPIEDMKAYALQLCLDINYERAGKYKSGDLKDQSFLALRYKLSDRSDRRLESFVRSRTGNFHLGQVPLKDEEGRGPFNGIFGQCMQFYRSKELQRFVTQEL